MSDSQNKLKAEVSDTTTTSNNDKDEAEVENETSKHLKENIQEVLEEVSTKVTDFKELKIINASDSSSDSDIIEEEVEVIDLETCSVRSYIENTVGQILLTALTILERERPENPINWLAQYLLFHKDDSPGSLEQEQPFEPETFNPIKLPKHVKKVITEDLQDLEIEAVNKLV